MVGIVIVNALQIGGECSTLSEQRYQGAWCSKCGHDMTSVPYGQPCPLCGHPYRTHGMVNSATAQGTVSMTKTVGKNLSATAKAYPDMEARAIPPDRGRSAYYLLIKTGYEFFRKTLRWHLRERLVDRRDNRYREYIEDAETGEVIRDKDQRLNEHVAERDLRK
jgi:hypothetical protein